jgi:mono/diheme cytochrome c family protein
MRLHRLLAPFTLVALLPLAASAAVDVGPIWQKKCASCHGKDGTADTEMGRKQKIKDMTKPEWQAKQKDSELKDAIENGVKDTKMKPFKDKLKPEEIDALVTYVRGLKK